MNLLKNPSTQSDQSDATAVDPDVLFGSEALDALETQEEQDFSDSLFAQPNDEDEAFYDFTKAMQVPDSSISFTNMRMLHTVKMLPNRHVLIEGGVMDQIVEVY